LILNLAWMIGDKIGVSDVALPELKRLGGMAMHLAQNTVQTRRCFLDYELERLPVEAIRPDAAVEQWRQNWLKQHAPSDQMDGTSSNVAGEVAALPFWSWESLQQARMDAVLQQPEVAAQNLKKSLSTMMDFAALNESANLELTNVHHPWFTTAAGAFVRALTHMLVIPREDEILLLPGIPASWQDLAFTMPAFGGVMVQIKLVAGQLSQLKLTTNRSDPRKQRVNIPKRFLSDPTTLGAKNTEDEGDHWGLVIDVQCE
jgi:hypothetical protein